MIAEQDPVQRRGNTADAGIAIRAAFARTMGSKVARYQRLADCITQLTLGGALRTNSQLPSDEDLAELLGISLGTVQRAMQQLKASQIIDRRHGAGTFVHDPSIAMEDVWHFRFLADDGVSYLPLQAQALSAGPDKLRGPWIDHLPTARPFTVVRRLTANGGEFAFLSRFTFDGARFPALFDQPLASFSRVVLRNLLTQLFAVRTENARQLLSTYSLSTDDLALLRPDTPGDGQLLETYGRCSDGLPVYYQRVIIPRNDRKLVVL